jgi:crotonobetainyl-CoA:carnitine CoA-transferase CaiB-like acyl-CoA transferase
MPKPQNMPLDGIKILDLARLGPGPHTSQILGDFGADVITVEPPSKGGKELKMPRGAPIRRNTRSMTLNLKSDAGREVFRKLVAQVDVVVEGFRPGVAERLGMDHESLRAIKPEIVSMSLSGFGQQGPHSGIVAHDLNYQAMAGIVHMTGTKDGVPEVPGNAVADNAGGITGALAIMMALFTRERTGVGQHIDVAMLDTLLTMQLLSVNQAIDFDINPQRGETMLTGAFPFYNVYECKDGKHLSVGAIEPWFYANLCKILGTEDFSENPRATGDVAAQRIAKFREIFKTKTRDEWVAELMHEETCVTPVYDLHEVMADEHFRQRGAIVDAPDPVDGTKTQVGLLFQMSETPGAIRRPAPELGSDTRDVLREIGYDEPAIDKIAAAGGV